MKGKIMRITLTIILVLGLAFGSVGVGFAADTQVVLNFDEINDFDLLTNYAGLTWQDGWMSYPDYSYSYNYKSHSGSKGIVFLGQSYSTGNTVWIDFSPLGTDVIFDGAYFGGHSGTGDIWFEGWRDGALVATSDHLTISGANENTSTYLPANFDERVDKIYVVTTTEQTIDEFIMDDLTYTISGEIDVNIDIMPNDTDTVNLKSKGLLPVGILGASEFDVTAIDPATVKIGDVGIVENGSKLQVGYEDINIDGYMDMVCKFSIPALIAGGELDAATTGLTITGDLLDDGGQFTGTDDIE